MSVYIKGMEMPKSCEKCPFLDYEEGFCFASGAENKSGWYEFTLCPSTIKGRRHDDCPLVPVSPHGDLIDRNAMMLRVDMHGTNKFGMLDDDIREFITAAPAIIPAEESET